MKIKRFQARDLKEALEQIKASLGPEALILSVKRQGLFNKQVEVTAAIDSPLEPVELEDEKLNSIQDEIKELKEIIKSFLPFGPIGDGVLPFFQQVKKRGLSEEIAMKLIEVVEEGLLSEGLARDISVKDFLYDLLSKLVNVLPPLERIDKRIALFIGPTGTGKTTTVAKLAGKLAPKCSVGLISLDNKPGGFALLEAYSRMLGLSSVRFAKGPTELVRLIEAYSDKDLILIDTYGLSPYNEFKMRDLIRNINRLDSNFISYLVLNVTMKEEEILRVVKKFQSIGISSLLFTKIDEAETFGTIFNQMIYTGKPLSYLGIGQIVPDDIELVTPYRIIELITNFRGNNYAKRNKKLQAN